MKFTKRIACGLCAAALLFTTACGQAPNSASGAGTPANPTGGAKGRFVETDLIPAQAKNDTPYLLSVRADGTIDYVALQSIGDSDSMLYRYQHYFSSDGGKTWAENAMEWQDSLSENGTQIFKLAIADNGDYIVLFAHNNNNSDLPVSGFLRITPDGTQTPLPIQQYDDAVAKGAQLEVTTMQILPGDKIFLHCVDYGGSFSAGEVNESNTGEGTQEDAQPVDPEDTENDASVSHQSGVVIFSANTESEPVKGVYDLATGQSVFNIMHWQGGYSAANETALFLYDYEGNITAYSLADGKPLSDFSTRVEVTEYPSNMVADKDGALYFVTNRGIFRIAPGGTLSETIMEGSMFSFGSPLNTIISFAATQDGGFLLAMRNTEGVSKLSRYIYDADAAAMPDKELRVFSLEDSNTVRAAITNFQQNNPEVRVNFEVGLTGDATVEDVLRTLNTELLAGKGPDVLLLGDMPLQSYIDKGVLADLAGKLDTSGLIENVIAPFQTEKGFFAMPVRFRVPVLVGSDSDLAQVNTWDDFINLITSGAQPPVYSENSDSFFSALPKEQQPAVTYDSLFDLFEELYRNSAPAILQDNKINEANLTKLFESVKAVSDKYKLTEENTVGGGVSFVVSAGLVANGIAMEISSGVHAYTSSRAVYGNLNLGDIMTLYFASKDDETNCRLMPGLSPGNYEPSILAGVAANSAQQDLAVQFIQAMLDASVQDYGLGDGLPVRWQSIENQVSKIHEDRDKQISLIGTAPSYRYDLRALFAGLKTPVYQNSTVKDKLYEQAQALCNGETTLEEAVAQAKADLQIYLQEKQ